MPRKPNLELALTRQSHVGNQLLKNLGVSDKVGMDTAGASRMHNPIVGIAGSRL